MNYNKHSFIIMTKCIMQWWTHFKALWYPSYVSMRICINQSCTKHTSLFATLWSLLGYPIKSYTNSTIILLASMKIQVLMIIIQLKFQWQPRANFFDLNGEITLSIWHFHSLIINILFSNLVLIVLKKKPITLKSF